MAALVLAGLTVAGCGDAEVVAPFEPDVPAPPVRFELRRASGTVFVADEGSVPSLDVLLMSGTDTTTLQVAEGSSTFDLTVRTPVGDTIALLIRPSSSSGYFPSLKQFPRSQEAVDQKVLLLPTAMVVPAGRFQGDRVPISLQVGVAPENLLVDGGNGTFYGFQRWLQPGGQTGGLDPDPDLSLWTNFWPAERLPLPLYFHHTGHNRQGDERGPISTADSVAIWSAINDLEDRLGLDAFEPAPLSAIPLDTLAGPFEADTVRLFAVGLQQIPSLANPGVISGFAGAVATCGTFPGEACTRLGPGILYEADVTLSSFAGAGPERVRWLVQHELVHALGFGHACFRPSVVAACSGGYPGETLEGGDPNPLATRYDAGYVHWYRMAHAAVSAHRPNFGLIEALDGERHVLLARPAVRREVRCLWGDITRSCAP